MNNLAIVQEATLGFPFSLLGYSSGVRLNNGAVEMCIIPPQQGSPHWLVWIIDDPVDYIFDSCAAAYDFAADELRLAM
jgi:hypothetical protein